MQIRPTRRSRRRRFLTWLGAGALGLLGITAVVGGLSKRNDQSQSAESGPPPTAAATPTPVPPDRRLIFTYYFYWYDATTGGHLNPSILRYHFPPEPLVSWRNVAWHEKQLSDMHWAGIDVALPVYWGFDRPNDAWSWQGLDVLARAWQDLKTHGQDSPTIGMFLDTTIVNWRNLVAAEGKQWFYANFHDFFTRIPRDQWALIDGRPVSFLFTSDWTTAMDQSTFDYVYENFQSDFGVRPYIVREVSWDYPILRWENGRRVRDYSRAIETDNSYLWAGAIHGFVNRGGVAEVGPGFDDHLVPGRGDTPVKRQNGEFYRRNFQAAIASRKPLLAIETWDELHEGSGIAETVEYGRTYLTITRQMAAAFHAVGQG